MKVVTPDQMKLIDEMCMLDYFMPGLLLMEHAGKILFDEAVKLLDKPNRITVVCGKNNGEDGLVAHDILLIRGRGCCIPLCTEFSLSGTVKSTAIYCVPCRPTCIP